MRHIAITECRHLAANSTTPMDESLRDSRFNLLLESFVSDQHILEDPPYLRNQFFLPGPLRTLRTVDWPGLEKENGRSIWVTNFGRFLRLLQLLSPLLQQPSARS